MGPAVWPVTHSFLNLAATISDILPGEFVVINICHNLRPSIMDGTHTILKPSQRYFVVDLHR